MKIGKSGAGGPVATGSDRRCRKRKRLGEEGKTLRSGIIRKSDGSYQVEVRPRGWGGSWKLHIGTYSTEAGAHVARDFCTFLRVTNEDVSKAGGYHFLESVKIFEEFERLQDPQVCELFRNVCFKCVNNLPNSTHSAGAVSPGKSKSSGSKDLDLKLLNKKARAGIREMMSKFKEFYPEEFATFTGVSETFMDEAEPRGNQVQTLHPFNTGPPSLGDIDLEELLTNEQWKILGELLKNKGDKYMSFTIMHHYDRVQGLAPSLHRELVSDPQVAGNYPLTSNKPLQSLPITLQGIQRAPDSAVDWTNGEPNIPLSFGTCFSTSLVQQQFSSEVEQRDHNGHHNLQDWEKELTLSPAHNQAFPNLEEVLKLPLQNANINPKDIPVIDVPENLPCHQCGDDNHFGSDKPYDNLFGSGDHFVNIHDDSSQWDYTKELK